MNQQSKTLRGVGGDNNSKWQDLLLLLNHQNCSHAHSPSTFFTRVPGVLGDTLAVHNTALREGQQRAVKLPPDRYGKPLKLPKAGAAIRQQARQTGEGRGQKGPAVPLRGGLGLGLGLGLRRRRRDAHAAR